jgi:mono/diheme cytochrome c family protein
MRVVPCIVMIGALAPIQLAAADAEEGARVYKDKCVACHGKEGAPLAPFAKIGVKDISDPEWQDSKGDEEIRKAVAEGTPETLMRAFSKELEPDQIDALVAFIRTLRREPARD